MGVGCDFDGCVGDVGAKIVERIDRRIWDRMGKRRYECRLT